MTDGTHEGRRRQHADARDGLQPCRDGMRAGDPRELAIESGNLLLESMHFIDDERDRLTQNIGHCRVGVGEDPSPH